MKNRKECPNCDSHATEQVHVEWWTAEVEEVRICEDCGAQYTNQYVDLIQEVDRL